MLARLKARLRENAAVRQLYDRLCHVAESILESLDHMRESILAAWLMVVYYAILTPVGLLRRMLGRGLPPSETRRGWQKIEQRSSDAAMYTKKF